MTRVDFDPRALLRERAKIERARRSTTGAVKLRGRVSEPLPWQVELGHLCDAVVDAAIAKTGISIAFSGPPRHGKTEWLGRGMPVRGIAESDEPMTILYATSSGDRAVEVSHRVRSAVARMYRATGDPQYKPGRIWGATEWETEGGHAWVSVGWSSSTGGIGCRLLIMDDLIGTRENYRSAATRRRIREVVEEDLLSRVMDGGSVVHMETRRGVDDTTAYLLSEYGSVWKHHRWKCHDPSRGEGDAAYLWPGVYGEAWRARMPHLHDLAPIWRSLYQQEPVPEGGTHIRPEWLEATYPEPPSTVGQIADKVVIGVDLAATGKTTSDHCAMVVVAVRGAYRDVVDVVRRQMSYVDAKRALRELAATWRPSDVLVEKAANGDALIEDLRSIVPGIDGARAVKDKVARLMPHTGAFAARQVRIPESPEPWVRSWKAELEAFSGTPGEPDDQVDATVWALVAAQSTAEPDADAMLDFLDGI